MRALASSVTLRSRGLWPAVTALALASCAAGLAGCFWGGSDPEPDPIPTVPAPTLDTPQQVAITPDKTLQSPAGDGVGIFVEYAAGGHWHVWTTCDTNKSSFTCAFEVFAIPEKGAQISEVRAEGLGSGDFAEQMNDGSAHLSASTSTELDGMTFDATPGAVVELEVYFDGVPEPHVVYWYGNETLHTGAPTDPVDFLPDSP